MIRLYELRAEKGLSQRDMAKELRVSQATYNNWENEKTQPSIEQLIALAEFFGVSVDYLIGRSGEEFVTPLPKENEMISLYLALDEDSRNAVKCIIKNLKK